LSVAAVAQDFDAAKITIERIDDDLFVLFGAGGGVVPGNTLVSIGADGVLVVDTQFSGMIPKVRAAVAQLGGGPIDFAVNTHWHDDHAEGNKVLGPAGVRIIAHENSRDMLMRHNRINVVRTVLDQPPYPDEALPVITFGSALTYYFNGTRVDLVHVAPAHTAGDAAVFFPERNTVHMGDVFVMNGYPFVDVDDGGDLDGMIAFCRTVLGRVDTNTVIVPGHGPLARRADLDAYVEMLSKARTRIAALIAAGASREQAIAAKPTSEWDAARGNPAYFVDRAYASLSLKR
jgi:glyoxylase-like metal-dependent hydrolase (beta-lactamase superfamily II)